MKNVMDFVDENCEPVDDEGRDEEEDELISWKLKFPDG